MAGTLLSEFRHLGGAVTTGYYSLRTPYTILRSPATYLNIQYRAAAENPEDSLNLVITCGKASETLQVILSYAVWAKHHLRECDTFSPRPSLPGLSRGLAPMVFSKQTLVGKEAGTTTAGQKLVNSTPDPSLRPSCWVAALSTAHPC